MKIDTTPLKVHLKKLQLSDQLSIFIVKFDYDKFKSTIETPSNFFKKLSNSKMSIPGIGSNRDWWKKHQPNGIYRYQISDNEITIKFFLESNFYLNEREIKLRVHKILKPKEMEFHLNDYDYYIYSISEVIDDVKEGMELFGGMRKKDLESLKNINDLMNIDYLNTLIDTDDT